MSIIVNKRIHMSQHHINNEIPQLEYNRIEWNFQLAFHMIFDIHIICINKSSNVYVDCSLIIFGMTNFQIRIVVALHTSSVTEFLFPSSIDAQH